MDIKAAPSKETNAVTSVVFWDGPSNVVGEYEPEDRENWLTDSCSCCFVTPFNQVKMRFSLNDNNVLIFAAVHYLLFVTLQF